MPQHARLYQARRYEDDPMAWEGEVEDTYDTWTPRRWSDPFYGPFDVKEEEEEKKSGAYVRVKPAPPPAPPPDQPLPPAPPPAFNTTEWREYVNAKVPMNDALAFWLVGGRVSNGAKEPDPEPPSSTMGKYTVPTNNKKTDALRYSVAGPLGPLALARKEYPKYRPGIYDPEPPSSAVATVDTPRTDAIDIRYNTTPLALESPVKETAVRLDQPLPRYRGFLVGRTFDDDFNYVAAGTAFMALGSVLTLGPAKSWGLVKGLFDLTRTTASIGASTAAILPPLALAAAAALAFNKIPSRSDVKRWFKDLKSWFASNLPNLSDLLSGLNFPGLPDFDRLIDSFFDQLSGILLLALGAYVTYRVIRGPTRS